MARLKSTAADRAEDSQSNAGANGMGPDIRRFAIASTLATLTFMLAACGASEASTTQSATSSGGVSPPVATTTGVVGGASVVTRSTGGSSAPGAAASAGRSGAIGPSVVITVNGYQFQVALVESSIRATPTFTTDDGTGLGSGNAIDAPPGNTLIVATLTIANKVDRPEPLDSLGFTGFLPNQGSFAFLAVPAGEAARFGITSCAATGVGYCGLGSEVGAHSNVGFQPQLAPGATDSITIVAGDPQSAIGSQGLIPEGAPVQDVKVFVPTSFGFGTGAQGWTKLN